LSGCEIGLVASKDEGTIAAEVRTHDSLKLNGRRELRTITTQVAQIPGWEFELIVTNPHPKAV